MGLRLRLNLLLSLIFFATMGVGTAILLNVLRHGVSEELSASVEQTAKLITVAVNHLPPALDDLKLQRVINDIATIGSTRHLRISTNVDRDSPFENVALEAPRWFFKLLVSEPLGLVRIVHLSDKRRQVVIRAAQSLTRRSLTIQEQERRDLAQALHDELGQSISAIRALGVSIQQNGDGGDGLNSSVKSIIEVSGTMYERVRDMMSLLRPSILDELGLRLALENMIDDWNSHYEDTFCRLEVSAILPDVEENIAINIFRIVQEALTNVARHARASDVSVEIAEQNIDEKPCLTLRIVDDGIGFNPRTVNKGLGIFGIEDRVAAMHGMLTLDSGASGTRYEIVVPLPQVAVQVSDVEKG